MRRQFERSGEVREVDLLAALVALWREKASVTLDFTRAGVSSGFDVADGEIVASFSADPRFETASILVRANKLDAAALERLAVPEGSDRAMAAMQAGVLTRREWKWGEKIRSIEVLSDLLTWSDGRYLVEPDTRSVSGEFRLPIPRLLLELFLRSRDRGLVEHQLGNPDVALARSAEFDAEFTTFGLTADAESVVRLIDGKSTAREIAAKAPADAFAVDKLLAALVTLGLVQPADSAAARTPEQPLEALPAPAPPPSPPIVPEDREEPALPADSPAGESLDAQLEWPAHEEMTATESLPELRPFSAAPGSEPDIKLHSEDSFGAQGLGAADAFETQVLDVIQGGPELPDAPAPAWDTLAPGPADPILERPEEPILSPLRRGQGRILVALFAVLAAAVLVVLFLRSRSSAPPADQPERKAAPPATALKPTEIPVPTPVAPPSPKPAAAKAVKPSPTSRPALTSPPVPPARAAPTLRPAAVVTKTAAPAAPPVAAGPDRKIWLDRAEAGRKRLAGEPSKNYSIQLMLACEVPTLQDAFKQDPPAGTMWLLTTDHAGRVCFRVLWGRFATMEEARKAKHGVPGHFVTPSNRPAIVALR